MISVIGKVEGQRENFHGHVTALSVTPEYRRLGLAAKLMNILNDVSVRLVYEKAVITKRNRLKGLCHGQRCLRLFSYSEAYHER